MTNPISRVLLVSFFKSETGNEPVRDWLKALPVTERKAISTPAQDLALARHRLKQVKE